MPTDQESPAVAVARAHVEAWSNHDFDARTNLAADVRVTSTTTQPIMKDVSTTGIDERAGHLLRRSRLKELTDA